MERYKGSGFAKPLPRQWASRVPLALGPGPEPAGLPKDTDVSSHSTSCPSGGSRDGDSSPSQEWPPESFMKEPSIPGHWENRCEQKLPLSSPRQKSTQILPETLTPAGRREWTQLAESVGGRAVAARGDLNLYSMRTGRHEGLG